MQFCQRVRHNLVALVIPGNLGAGMERLSGSDRTGSGTWTRGTVPANGEQVRYEIYAIDARTGEQRARNDRLRQLDGHVVVLIPGHGQTVRGPRNLVETAARLSRSGLAWCIDPVPARGGDLAEGQAIAAVVRSRLRAFYPATEEQPAPAEPPGRAIIAGWSHGASEALRAAQHDPATFPQFLGLCPTGLVERHPLGLIYDFFLEAIRIVVGALGRWDWACLGSVWRVGLDLCWGLARDLARTRSPKRLIDDLSWASRKVPGQMPGYTGEMVLLFGSCDTVVRWQGVFPDCQQPEQIGQALQTYKNENLPLVRRLELRVVDGDHLGPEVRPDLFLRLGLGLLGQLDSPPTR